MNCLAISLCLCVSLCGCFFVGDPRPYGYVSRKGGAETIGKWTMDQTNGQKIYHGIGALTERLDTTSSEREAQHAEEWFLRIVKNVEDWPTDHVTPDGWTTKHLIDQIFFTTAGEAYHHPKIRALLYRARPDDDRAKWRYIWQSSIDYLEHGVIPPREKFDHSLKPSTSP